MRRNGSPSKTYSGRRTSTTDWSFGSSPACPTSCPSQTRQCTESTSSHSSPSSETYGPAPALLFESRGPFSQSEMCMHALLHVCCSACSLLLRTCWFDLHRMVVTRAVRPPFSIGTPRRAFVLLGLFDTLEESGAPAAAPLQSAAGRAPGHCPLLPLHHWCSGIGLRRQPVSTL